ncbi:YecR family lipoprotein [Pseudomonas sp. PvP001]|uniref:YecR family lipoprotein n=1 Tax=Pseudomonas sp. PvP001 TaxID=3158559 RepID=UPI003391A342
MDGSRSDAVVDVAYDPGTKGVTASGEQRGLALAKSKCAAWGYTGSEAFGGRNAICLSFSALGCSSYRTVVKYQCQGNPDSVQPFGLPPSAGQGRCAVTARSGMRRPREAVRNWHKSQNWPLAI